MFLKIFPDLMVFLTVVLLIPSASAASVIVENSSDLPVSMFAISTATPMLKAVVADILAFVSSESFIPFRVVDILALFLQITHDL